MSCKGIPTLRMPASLARGLGLVPYQGNRLAPNQRVIPCSVDGALWLWPTIPEGERHVVDTFGSKHVRDAYRQLRQLRYGQ